MPVSKKILTLLALLPAMVALAVFDPIGLGNRSETHLSLVPEAKKNIEGPIVFSGILPSNAQQPGLVEFSSKFAAAKLQTEGQAKTCSHTNCSVAENLHVNQKYAEARLLLMKKTSDAVAQTVDF